MYKVEIKLKISDISKKSTDLVFSLINESDFQATHMDILMNYSKPLLQNQKFDNITFIKLMGKYPDSITLNNKSNIKSFFQKIEIKFVNVDKIDLLQNVTLSFFTDNINNTFIDGFIKILQEERDFIYLYAYNFDYAFDESNISLEKFDDGHDKLLNYGRNLKIKGYSFIAAPIMYFGELYSEVITFPLLFSLKDIFSVKFINEKVVCLKLYDLYDDPTIESNRQRQKEYWDFLETNSIINNFTKKTTFNFFDFLKNQK